MKNKGIFIQFFFVCIIFLSYYFLYPIKPSSTPISENSYTCKIFNTTTENKWATFRQEKNGSFFIHPGEKKPSIGVFTFKNSYNLELDFWINNESVFGDVEFNITKNGLLTNNIIVTYKDKERNKVFLKIDNGDVLEIRADKHGITNSDWGQMKISSIDNLIYTPKNFIIPFLWSLLFIFLMRKKYEYLFILSYLLFILILLAEKMNFGFLLFKNIFIYTVFIFALTFVLVFIYQELRKLKRIRIAIFLSLGILFLVYMIPVLFIFYVFNFNTKITNDIVFAIFQSNANEVYEYILDYISFQYITFFILGIIIIGFLLYKQAKRKTVLIEKSLLVMISIVFSIVAISHFLELRLPDFLIHSFKTYTKELRLFTTMQEKRRVGNIKFSATKIKKDETYIVVIGESLNKKHMGIYGYIRDTTPNLTKMKEKNELLIFNNIYSNHTHTVPTLSMALTESNQYNKKIYNDSVSIMEIIKKAMIENYWLTNQVIYGIWNNLVSIVGMSSDHLVSLNKYIGIDIRTDYHDGALIEEVKKILIKKSNQTRIIFIHLMGSHNRYSARYPHSGFTVFKGPLKTGEYGTSAAVSKNINTYDNSIVYNDHVVSSILNELQKKQGVAGFIYISDHGEDVIGNIGHSSDNFSFEMIQIPMIAWFNNAYKKRYSEKFNILKNHTETLFSNDMWYDTLIGIMGISTNKYNAKYDLSSKNYVLNPKDALILHGKKHYTHNSNYIYWQKRNAKYLIESNQSSRIFPHRVDSIGKLRDVWNNGFKSFEVDVRFGDDNTETFIVNHNKGMNNIKLDKFLSYVNVRKIQKVWLDFKNLDETNYIRALKRLEYLDTKYHLKDKFIVESNTKKEFFKYIGNKGWHTSYYLPTTIVNLLNNKNVISMEEVAQDIAHQISLQKLSAISFDNRIYPFVKKYLEPKISRNIVYHTWYAPSLSDSNFRSKLVKDKVYQDNRVKTLLTAYKSQFHL